MKFGIGCLLLITLSSCATSLSLRSRLVNESGTIQNCQIEVPFADPTLLYIQRPTLEKRYELCVNQAKAYGYLEMKEEDFERILSVEESKQMYTELKEAQKIRQ